MEPGTRRGLSGVLLLALLFSLAPIAFFPSAAALTWSSAELQGLGNGPGQGVALAANGANVIVVFEDGQVGDLSRFISSDSGVTFGAQADIYATGTVGELPDVTYLDSNSILACAKDTTNSVYKYFISNDGGASWAAVSGEASSLARCAVGTISASSAVLFYHNTGVTDGRARITTDGAATFGTLTTVTTANLQPIYDTFVLESASKWAVVFGDLVCYTTDTGVSYNCATVDGATVDGLTFFDGIWYATTFATTSAYLHKSSSPLGPWALNNFATTPRNIVWMDPIIHDEETYSVFLCYGTSAQAAAPTIRRYSTTDAGVTWAFETVDAGPNTNHGCGTGDVELVNGLFVSAHSFVDGTSGTLRYSTAVFSSTDLTALASVAVTNLVGFDVADNGGSLVARNSAAGVSVNTYNPISLTQTSSTGTDCSTTDRVLTDDSGLVSYIKCNPAGTDTAVELETRTNNGAVPSCASGRLCDFDFPITDASEGDDEADDLNKMSRVIAFPLNWEQQDTTFFNTGLLAFAGILSTGEVAVFALDSENDDTIATKVPFAGNTPEDLCVFQNGATTLVGAVNQGTLTGVWSVSFNGPPLPIGAEDFQATMTGPQTFPAAIGISCTEDRIMLGLETQMDVRLYDQDTGTAIWSLTGKSLQTSRAVAISADGEWCAYAEQSIITICDADTGASLGTVAMPSGTWHSMKLSRAGQYLWAATDDFITVWDVHSVTTITSQSDSESGSTTLPATTPAAGLFGGGGAAVATGLGTSTFGGNLLLGTMTVVFSAALLWTGFAFAPVMLIVGAVLGVILAWGFGFYSGGVVFVIVLLAGAGLYLFRGRGAGG